MDGFGDTAVGVQAAGGDDPDFRFNFEQGMNCGRAVHDWHHHIGQDEIDGLTVDGKNADSLRAVFCCHDLVAKSFEGLAGHTEDGAFVIDQ